MKKYIFIIYCVVFAYHSYSQVDTNNFYWRKVLYEVYSTQQDSLAFYPYYLKKKPYFESYFNSYTEAELKKMQEKSFDMMYYPNKDSLRDPAYLQEQAYSWVISRMLFGYYLDNLYDSLQTAYDAKGDTIELDFYLKGKHVNLYRNYRIIYLVYTENGEKNRIDACTLENAFLAPDIGMDTAGIVLLKYKRRYYDITFCEKHLQELKKSNETYVFNFNEFGNNVFSTDGDKLYINYSINDNGKSKEAGQTIFSNLRHETTHGIQFEYGELGFENIGNNQWTAINYDIMDEYEANNNQNYGFRWKSGDGTDRDIWVNLSSDNKIKSLVNSYKNIPIETHNNANTEKLKDEKYYALPNRARSSVGKCFDQKKMLLDWYEGPLFDYKWYNVLRNDTIFGLIRYTKIDSVIICDTNVHMHGKWWLRISDDEDEIIISQSKKVHPSKKSMLNFSIGQEVQCIRKLVYDRYFRLREKHFTIGYLSYSGEIVSPKKSMKKKLLKVYLNTKQIEP